MATWRIGGDTNLGKEVMDFEFHEMAPGAHKKRTEHDVVCATQTCYMRDEVLHEG